MASAEQARIQYPLSTQADERGARFRRLEDDRLSDTALKTNRHYCAGCYAPVLDLLFFCPYCTTHFTIPRDANQMWGCEVDELLMETCTEHMELGAAPAQAGGDTPVPAAPTVSKEEINKITKINLETKSGQISVPG
eukprot:8274250-Alexandrium_andersonii.AAC.1